MNTRLKANKLKSNDFKIRSSVKRNPKRMGAGSLKIFRVMFFLSFRREGDSRKKTTRKGGPRLSLISMPRSDTAVLIIFNVTL